MHYLMLLTMTMLPGESSHDARHRAFNELLNDPSFCGDGGRFGSPLGDYFVIGGAWSGYLREIPLGQPYQQALRQEFPQFTAGYAPSKLIEEHKDGLNQLWQRFGGTGSHPLNRRFSGELGQDDDALVVDDQLYGQFLEPHQGLCGTPPESADGHVVDLDDDCIDASFIGRKWLVVVDYHN
jgi:hypothetical protein